MTDLEIALADGFVGLGLGLGSGSSLPEDSLSTGEGLRLEDRDIDGPASVGEGGSSSSWVASVGSRTTPLCLQG